MGIASLILGKAASQPIEAVGKVLDGLFTSDEERLDKQALLTKLAQQPELAQIELNKIEAQHRTLFVAGWRPFIGWVCGTAIAYHFIAQPIAVYVLTIASPETQAPPALDFAPLMTLVLSLLGLGSLRTVEKGMGRAK